VIKRDAFSEDYDKGEMRSTALAATDLWGSGLSKAQSYMTEIDLKQIMP